jgi:hypothetical protein
VLEVAASVSKQLDHALMTNGTVQARVDQEVRCADESLLERRNGSSLESSVTVVRDLRHSRSKNEGITAYCPGALAS